MGNLHILHACFNVVVHLAHHLPHCHRCASRRWTQELPSCPRGLVESSALYSISLILYIAFLARNNISSIYFDTLAAFARVNSHPFSVFRSNKHHTGSCSNNPCWARRSRSRSPRRLLAGQCHIRLTSLRGTFWKSWLPTEFLDES